MTARRALRIGLRIAGVALAVLVLVRVSEAIQSNVLARLMEHHASMVETVVLIALLTYTVLIAIPFVPGVEIGMALLGAFGASIAAEVYIATVVGLMLGYAVGRLVPVRTTARMLDFLCLTRAAEMLNAMSGLTPDEIAAHLSDGLGGGGARRLLRWRYLALIVLINTPGNIVVGGGGGLALLAGMSRIFPPWGFLAAVLVAVLPVPLAIFVMSGD